MRIPLRITALLLLFVVHVQSAAAQTRGINAPEQRDKPYVVLVSFDGFRHDYLGRPGLKNFKRLMAEGSTAYALIPSFPTKTFPTHITIATGKSAGSHGIVANRFFDPQRNARYKSSPPEVLDGSWYNGEAIWATAEKQGMVAATYFWPGSEAVIDGARASHYFNFDAKVKPETQVAKVGEWLKLPATRRPHMIALYFANVDEAGHRHGPESAQVDSVLLEADRVLGLLLHQIDALPFRDRINLIVTSDHGIMATRGWHFVEDYTALEPGEVIDQGPVVYVYPKNEARTVELLRALQRMPNVRAYLREDTPRPLALRNNPRAGRIVVIAEPGWQIGSRALPADRNPASHGWDPGTPEMMGIFIVRGPNIPRGRMIPPFASVHVYPFMTRLLGLVPSPGIDGRVEVLERALLTPDSAHTPIRR